MLTSSVFCIVVLEAVQKVEGKERKMHRVRLEGHPPADICERLNEGEVLSPGRLPFDFLLH